MDDAVKSNDNLRDSLIQEYKRYTEQQDALYPDGTNAQKVIASILKLQHDKEAVYGQSWRKYGHMSAFLNTARKWDRIDVIMRKAMQDGLDVLFSDEGGTAQETFLDTVVDLASYSLLWVGYLADEHPEMWERFLEANKLNKA